MLVTLTTENFEDVAIASPAAIVTFRTATSEAFALLEPDLEALASAYPGVIFGTIDAEQQPRLAAAARIEAIPTIVAFREGNLVFREVGALSREVLEQLVNQLLDLDMRLVAEQLAARRQGQQKAGNATPVTVEEFSASLSHGIHLIDVRTPLEYKAQHVATAVNIPLHAIARSTHAPSELEGAYLICKDGERAAQASGLLASHGLSTSYVVGGMVACAQAGLTFVADQLM